MALDTAVLDSGNGFLQHLRHHVNTLTIRPSIFALGFLLVCLLYFILYGLFLCPTRHLPGPFITRFTKIYWLKIFFGGSIGSDILSLHRKYGIPLSLGGTPLS